MTKDDDVCSEWFQGVQGLGQGCVLSPLLFKAFFAAILFFALYIERFSDNADKLVNLVHLEKQASKVGPETALE